MCFIKIIGSFYGPLHIEYSAKLFGFCCHSLSVWFYTRSAILRIRGIFIYNNGVRSIIVDSRTDKCINVFISIVFAIIWPFFGGLVGWRETACKKKTDNKWELVYVCVCS